jgi:hypothetical protein
MAGRVNSGGGFASPTPSRSISASASALTTMRSSHVFGVGCLFRFVRLF